VTRHHQSWDRIREDVAPSGIGRRVLDGAGASLVTVRVPAGFEGGRHSHPHEQFVQVLSGSGLLTTEQGECAFGPGSVFHFEANAWHIARFDAETVLVETNFRV